MKSGSEETDGFTADEASVDDVSPSEMFLQAARQGNNPLLRNLLAAVNEKKLKIDINCKGMTSSYRKVVAPFWGICEMNFLSVYLHCVVGCQKSNFGWTPLHLSSYFGHADTVKLLLEVNNSSVPT